jgi:hypothetical protein
VPPWKQPAALDELDDLRAARLRHVVEVREPVVLVSQIQRSAGTLLSQLLDGHPECHAHSQELQIGHPNIRDWPELDLSAPETWLEGLYEPKAGERLRDGYSKAPEGNAEVFPFCFLPSLQRAIFDRCVAGREIRRDRDVLDCYFTSYFNAWLDNHNLYTGPKRAVTAFAPGLGSRVANVERFFDAYPDGLLVALVRDPVGWYGSASAYKPSRYGSVEQAIPAWVESTEAALEAAARYGDRVALLTYRQLVERTEETMRALADRIGLSWSPVLLEPTFNGRPIRANSSFAVDRYGVLPERADGARSALEEATRARITELAGELYDRVAAAAG